MNDLVRQGKVLSWGVSEWTADWFEAASGGGASAINPVGPPAGTNKTVRGGSYSDTAEAIRISARTDNMPYRADDAVADALVADAGEAAYKAALSKDLDQMLEVGGTVTEACAACHEVYRDKDDQAERCIPPAAAANQ